MRRHVHLDAPGQPALRIDHRDDRIDLLGRPGDHRLTGRGEHRHGYIGVVGDQRPGRLGIQFQQRHRALPRKPRHQPRPGRDHPQPLSRAQRPGHHRRGHLPHRMPDHRIGFHTVGAPQFGQRQLHADQHWLNPVNAFHRLTSGQDLLHRKAGLGHERGLQFGNRRRERRLIGQQLPAHPGPLRALTRIHEHRARPARPRMCVQHPRRRAAGRQCPEPGHRLVAIMCAHRTEVLVTGSTVIDGVGDIGQRHLGALAGHPVRQHARR